jgi:hypothetical protein
MNVVFYYKKERHISTVEQFCIYKERDSKGESNNEHTVMYNVIFDAVLKIESY